MGLCGVFGNFLFVLHAGSLSIFSSQNMRNPQIHKRLSKEQVVAILENYLAGAIKARDAQNNLGLSKSHFFRMAAEYKKKPNDFDIKHKGNAGNRKISEMSNKSIITELEKEKQLIDNNDIPIRQYNYSAIKDLLEEKHGVSVSLPTIINRAKERGYYHEKIVKKIHDREVLTNLVGELAQHDSSHHLWSPYMTRKLYLITTIDDYSRLLLYAELVEAENTWAHIEALKSVFLQYGCPLRYYADQHSIFRYVKDRDKHRPFNTLTKFTDDVDPQWRQVLKQCNVAPVYALSPQAKGKIERPYRWLQDRIVRVAAKEHIDTIEGLRKVLRELVHTYNTKWVHSTTKEIPIVRFENAINNKKSLFTAFTMENAEQTLNDIFCLRIQRMVDSYRKVSVNGFELRVPNGHPKETVELRIVPDAKNELVKVRFWQRNTFLGEILEKMENLPIVRF
jgi:transposase